LSKIVDDMLTRPSAIRSMMKFGDERNIRAMGLDPKDVISFGGGWVGHHAPERLREIYAEICNDPAQFHQTGAYPPIPGIPACRGELARMDEVLYGVKATERNVIVGQSSTELTQDLMRAILNCGDDVLLLDPTYVNYYGQLVFTLTNWHLCKDKGHIERLVPDAEVAYVRSFDPASWTFMPNVDKVIGDMEEAFEIHKPGAVLIASPDNPTGQIVPQKFMEAVLELCQKNDAYFVIDFAYKTQTFVDQLPEYFSWSPNEFENLILIYSASKYFRSLGRRLGWVVGPEKIIVGMETMLTYSILSADNMHQMAMAQYLEETIDDGNLKKYFDDINESYKKAARITIDCIDEYIGLRRTEPQGALYVVMEVGEDGEKWAKETLRNTGVIFIPGFGFGESLRNGVRVSYGPLVETTDKITDGLKRVGEYVKGHESG
jgi:aspartate/methionine/tyrosine aminotransferase